MLLTEALLIENIYTHEIIVEYRDGVVRVSVNVEVRGDRMGVRRGDARGLSRYERCEHLGRRWTV